MNRTTSENAGILDINVDPRRIINPGYGAIVCSSAEQSGPTVSKAENKYIETMAL